ncbi:MAG: sulfite exporter TauE/SafE family protein [Chloroflexi bacterium]|nr:sulfite exporter TauE/SafE family protein [Chloroflexota bacterium]
MEYLIVTAVAFFTAALTLFSGFGLGTVLMPAFALFFPVPIAVAATAVVHLANNLFKVGLVGRQADKTVLIQFALPGALAAMFGAAMLNGFAGWTPLATYALGARTYEITPVKLIIGIVIVVFALFDLLPRFQKLAFDRKYLPLGGIVSGFFGGLSGNQGALRSAFLIKAGLNKDAFIGTGTVAAVIVDLARLIVYGAGFYATQFAQLDLEIGGLVLAATVAAFLGSYLGARLVKKVTLGALQLIVGVLLIVIGVGMASGLF